MDEDKKKKILSLTGPIVFWVGVFSCLMFFHQTYSIFLLPETALGISVPMYVYNILGQSFAMVHTSLRGDRHMLYGFASVLIGNFSVLATTIYFRYFHLPS